MSTAAHGLGRRKSAVAQVQLVEAAGEQQVNGQPLADYFPTVALQTNVRQPLVLTSQEDTLGFKAKVTGGGKQAQADAVKLALARAITEADNGHRKHLKSAGALRRDPRVKERKKPGLKRARRAPQFSKR